MPLPFLPAPAVGPAPTVSIGLPIYNGERFMAQALDSLLAQTFTDFELIISDNASTDATAGICAEYARRDVRVRYVRQPVNIGAPRNWSYVVTVARGRYFKWASVNDWCTPELLQCCVATLETRAEAVLCQPRVCLVDETSGEQQPYGGDFDLCDETPSGRFEHLLRALQLNNAQSGLIRLATLRQTGLDRPYEGGDIPLMAELALRGCFVLLPETMLYRRMGGSTFSRGLVGEAKAKFYGSRSSELKTALRRDADLALGIWRAPIRWRERLRAWRHLARVLAWDLSRELRASSGQAGAAGT